MGVEGGGTIIRMLSISMGGGDDEGIVYFVLDKRVRCGKGAAWRMKDTLWLNHSEEGLCAGRRRRLDDYVYR